MTSDFKKKLFQILNINQPNGLLTCSGLIYDFFSLTPKEKIFQKKKLNIASSEK